MPRDDQSRLPAELTEELLKSVAGGDTKSPPSNTSQGFHFTATVSKASPKLF